MKKLLVRALAATGVATTAVALMASPASAAAPVSPWLQTGYNAAHSNANVAEKTIDASNVGHLKHDLTLNAGKASQEICRHDVETPTFSQSRVYAVIDDHLVARDLYTGKVVFRVALGSTGTYHDWMAVSHGLVIVRELECGSPHPGGDVAAYNAQTGKQVWEAQFPRYAENWEYDNSVSGKYLVSSLVCYYCGDGGQYLAVNNLYDGSLAWKVQTSMAISHTEVVDGRVFATGKKSLRAYDLATGTLEWTDPGAYSVVGGDSDVGGTNLIADTPDGSVADLDPATGKVRFDLPSGAGPVAVTSSEIFTTCASGMLCAYKESDGSQVWKVAQSAGGVIYANGLLYLDDGTVLNASNGAVVTTLPGRPALVGSGHVGLYPSDVYTDNTLTILGTTG